MYDDLRESRHNKKKKQTPTTMYKIANNKVLQPSTGNYSQYPVINDMEKNKNKYKKKYIYVCVYMYIKYF